MSEVEKIVEAYKAGNSQETQGAPVETVANQEQPGTTQEPQETGEQGGTVETLEQPGANQETTGNDQETAGEQQPPKKPKDTSMYSKEEKAQHAFKRQLARQKEKFENQVAELTGSFRGSLDEIKKQVQELKEQKKAAEPEKTRADFSTDDEYISYLTSRGVDKALAAEREAQAKENEKKAAQEEQLARIQKEQQEIQETFTGYCRDAFPDAKEFKTFSGKVDKALKNGLGEILDNAPAVRDYIFGHADGPVVLNEMLSNKDSFVRVMNSAGNPMDAAIEIHDLLREIRERATVPPTVATMPHLGKPGSSSAGAYGGNGYNLKSDDDIVNYLRSRAR